MNKKYIMQVVSYKETAEIKFVWNVRKNTEDVPMPDTLPFVYGPDMAPDAQPIEELQAWLPQMMIELSNFEDLGVIIFEEPAHWAGTTFSSTPFKIDMAEVPF